MSKKVKFGGAALPAGTGTHYSRKSDGATINVHPGQVVEADDLTDEEIEYHVSTGRASVVDEKDDAAGAA